MCVVYNIKFSINHYKMEENFTINLVDAKNEYTKELIKNLHQNIYEGIYSIYQDAKILHEQDNKSSILKHFQLLLCTIPKWDQEVITEEVNRIKSSSGCDWIEDLLTAVFLSHTKILTSINRTDKTQKINLKVPKLDTFIHKCYIEVARFFYRNTYLFNEELSRCDIQRNRRESESAIINCISDTIRKTLPIKQILSDLDNIQNQSIENEDNTHQENLKLLVKDEIINMDNNKLDQVSNNLSKEISSEENSNLEMKIDEPLQLNSTSENIDNVIENNNISEQDLDALVETELKNENDLLVEDLDLDGFDDLNNLEEIYVDDKEENSVSETPVEDNLVSEPPVEDNLVGDTPVEENLVSETPVEENSVSETPVEENAVNDTPDEENPNIKKIVLTQNQKNDEDVKKKILRKYIRNKSDFNFFN